MMNDVEGVGRPTVTDPGRIALAIERVRRVLNEVDYGCGHFITGDNLKIMDVQILYDLAQPQPDPSHD